MAAQPHVASLRWSARVAGGAVLGFASMFALLAAPRWAQRAIRPPTGVVRPLTAAASITPTWVRPPPLRPHGAAPAPWPAGARPRAVPEGAEAEPVLAAEPMDLGGQVPPGSLAASAALGTATGVGLLGVLAAATEPSAITRVQRYIEGFSNLFPLWTALTAIVALRHPASFAFMSTNAFTVALSCLMFSMGITLTADDFLRVMKKPVPVAINFFCCYVVMPAIAYTVAQWYQLSPAFTAGLVMVGAINGGQASNLCTLIAKGDVALSVLMTTTTTVGCIFMTPLVAWAVLGAIVAVDSWGIALSTIQIVMLPIMTGVLLNKYFPKLCAAMVPFSPLLGILSTILLVGGSVASSAPALLKGGLALQWPVILFHFGGGLAGYLICRLAGLGESVARTTALETAMKSSAFVYLLCCVHFAEYLVRVPCAVSVVWNAIIGSSMAVLWRFIPLPPAPPSASPEPAAA